MRTLLACLLLSGLLAACAHLSPQDFSHKGGTYETVNKQALEKAYEACRLGYSSSADDMFKEGDSRTMECYIQRCMTAKSFIYNGMTDWCTDR